MTSTPAIILITGASEGIGRALALRYAKEGARLGIAARNAVRLDELAKEIVALGAPAPAVFAGDLAREADCRQAVELTVKTFGGLDTLVNNAGITMWATFEETTDPGLIAKVMEVNYYSVAYCTLHALPHLKKSRGRIVAVSSLAGVIGVPGHVIYGASKHAIHGFINSLRIELEPAGVSCTIVAPDFVVTEIHNRGLRGDGKAMQKRLDPKKFMSADTCAGLMKDGIERRDRLLMTSPRGRLAAKMRDLIPGAILDKIAARGAKKGALH